MQFEKGTREPGYDEPRIAEESLETGVRVAVAYQLLLSKNDKGASRGGPCDVRLTPGYPAEASTGLGFSTSRIPRSRIRHKVCQVIHDLDNNSTLRTDHLLTRRIMNSTAWLSRRVTPCFPVGF